MAKVTSSEYYIMGNTAIYMGCLILVTVMKFRIGNTSNACRILARTPFGIHPVKN
jgi:hypothetical protein